MIDWETMDPLTALTHLDGRNGRKLTTLRRYFSEFAWMKMREEKKLSSLVDTLSLLEDRKVVQLDRFIRFLGLVPRPVSTQIAPYDSLVRYMQSVYRINSILLDLTKNMWLYVLTRESVVAKRPAGIENAL